MSEYEVKRPKPYVFTTHIVSSLDELKREGIETRKKLEKQEVFREEVFGFEWNNIVLTR